MARKMELLTANEGTRAITKGAVCLVPNWKVGRLRSAGSNFNTTVQHSS